MKNLFLGMVALAMLASASCSAQRIVTTDSTKQAEVVVVYDDVYYNPWYQNTWQVRPYYVRPHHRGFTRHPGANMVEKRDDRPQGQQYRKGQEPTRYNAPQMRPGMRGMNMNPQMRQEMQKRMQNGQPGMMRPGMQNRPPQMRPNTNTTRPTPPTRKTPGIDEDDLSMDAFIQYINYKE